jgi:hypothetical protein
MNDQDVTVKLSLMQEQVSPQIAVSQEAAPNEV